MVVLRLGKRVVRKLRAKRTVPGIVTIKQGAAVVRSPITIRTTRIPHGSVARAATGLFWNDGHMECPSEAARHQATLQSPDWRISPARYIYFRPYYRYWTGVSNKWDWISAPQYYGWFIATPTGVTAWHQLVSNPFAPGPPQDFFTPWLYSEQFPFGFELYVIGAFDWWVYYGPNNWWHDWNYVPTWGPVTAGYYCYFG